MGGEVGSDSRRVGGSGAVTEKSWCRKGYRTERGRVRFGLVGGVGERRFG